MIEDALRCEVVEASLFGLELKADEREGLAIDNADGREGTEGLGRVLQNFVIHGCVACVDDLHCLIDRFTRSAGRE